MRPRRFVGFSGIICCLPFWGFPKLGLANNILNICSSHSVLPCTASCAAETLNYLDRMLEVPTDLGSTNTSFPPFFGTFKEESLETSFLVDETAFPS